MDTLRLVEPAAGLEEAFNAYLEDHRQAGELDMLKRLPVQGFNALAEALAREAQGLDLPAGYVPHHTYWMLDGERMVGESGLRHYLTPSLKMIGGHIGYRIAPTYRRRGYGTRILALTLQKARDLGLPRVMLTCDTSNTASARIIEKNGGVLAGRFSYNPSEEEISHYWIDLTAPGIPSTVPAANARVKTAHRSPDAEAMVVQHGDELELRRLDDEYPGWVLCTNTAGQEGWVPLDYMEVVERQGVVQKDYSTIELAVKPGDELTLHFQVSGWYWATDRRGCSGWLPVKSIEA